jgi:hypothetical protein
LEHLPSWTFEAPGEDNLEKIGLYSRSMKYSYVGDSLESRDFLSGFHHL